MVTPSHMPGADAQAKGDRQLEANRDLIAARGDWLIRVGGVFSPLAAIVTLFVLRVLGGGALQLAIAVGVFAAVGQGMVWLGMRDVRRTCGWGSGIMFHLTIGGVLSGQTLFLTDIPELMPIPLVAPLVATFARWRMRRAARSAGVAR